MTPIDVWIEINRNVTAKDKLYRLVQYFSRFLAHHISILSDAAQKSPELAIRLRRLVGAIGLARKRKPLIWLFIFAVFRVGKWLEECRIIRKAFTIANATERLLCIGKAVGLACWLFLDTFQWLHRHGIVLFDSIYLIDRIAGFSWLASVLCSIGFCSYKLIARDYPNEMKQEMNRTFAKNLIISLCDLPLPLSVLGYVSNDGLVGACGAISSLLFLSSIKR